MNKNESRKEPEGSGSFHIGEIVKLKGYVFRVQGIGNFKLKLQLTNGKTRIRRTPQ